MGPPLFTGWAKTWHDEEDISARLKAIGQFNKAMKDPSTWKRSWDDAGGTAGILHLLSLGSVQEVKAFSQAIQFSRHGLNKYGDTGDRERAIIELVMALLPKHYPSTRLRTQDKRPLQKAYGRMLRGCLSSFVEQVLNAQDPSNPLFQELHLRKLLPTHHNMLKTRLKNYMIHEGPQLSKPEMEICFREFVFRGPSLPGTQPHFSASMQFALELLEARVSLKCTAERWPPGVSELEVLMSVYRRLTRRSRSSDKTFFFKLGLQLIEVKPAFKSTIDANVLWSAIIDQWKRHPGRHEYFLTQGLRLGLRGNVLHALVTQWKDDPTRYQELLAQSLRLGCAGSAAQISVAWSEMVNYAAFSEASNDNDPQRDNMLRWRLLRLYCQHVPKEGIDIDKADDFACLANQEWSYETFGLLDRNHAIVLLRGLYRANPNFDFLKGPAGHTSIFAMRKMSSRRNFNVELLLTSYRQDDADTRQKARDEVDRLRKMSATCRDQSDRALFAKAAAYYAIATGDLEVYAETILWQQRFIRDSLTFQTLFATDVMLTDEGMDLLTGIPGISLNEITLETFSKGLTAADQILNTFNDIARMAKNEPSSRRSHRTGFDSIYGSVYERRIDRAKRFIKLHPPELGLDVFNIIWERVMDLVNSIGSDFLNQVKNAVLGLLDVLNGPFLVAAVESLVDCASQWGKKQGRNKDQDMVTDALEFMSYQAVAILACGQTPTLAQDLIRRTIIEHPEASTWHRYFLSLAYMKKLPAKAAEAMLLSFAAAIGEKLDEQSYVKVGDKEPPQSAPPVSIIKVTTVKHLAQLLNNAEFIAPDSALEVLLELFKAGTHIDIRLATLDSLLSTLNGITSDAGDQWRSDPVIERILSTMESVILIAGNVSERKPVSAQDWKEAEENDTLPALSEEHSETPPLFSAIIAATKGVRYRGLLEMQSELFSRLLLPTLRQSQEQYRKWFSLFLAKHGSTLNVDSLPRVPINPRILTEIIHELGPLVPSSVIDEYNEYILLRIAEPAAIRKFNTILRSDATLRNDASVKRWLYVFGERLTWSAEMRTLLNLIRSPSKKVASDTCLMDAFISQVAVLLDDYESHEDDWRHLLESLKPGIDNYTNVTESGWAHWSKTTRNLTGRLISLLGRKRASFASPGDATLPSAFPLEIWSLPYPMRRSVRENNAGCRDLVTKFDLVLLSFFSGDGGEILLWDAFANDAYKVITAVYGSTSTRLRIAAHIGDISSDHIRGHGAREAAVKMVKVSVALKLVDSVSGGKALRKPGADSMSTADEKKGELVRRLRAHMERWGLRNGAQAPAGVKHLAFQWKSRNKDAWEDICSWGDMAVAS
ncbi:hypothetical protein F5Y19DRAFT_487970 [Xylariaceae sp. FL1651]|nr:hypothetical protein F5Y19DRAFT_487970 [Xylariaceae sp. FL1651]